VRREITLVKKEITVIDSFEGNRDADLSVRWNSPLKAGLERLAITSDQSFCEEWHESDHKTGLGINCLRYGSPGPGWLRIARIKGRMGKIVTRIPFVSKAKD
jgi:hypothetical protein